ncbi:probable glutamate receptor [Bacillus rossius redtenbacheri]|uniref:probable glutamate receptor n=1 Tax=Bacillus rossius redtenbacheri TaxID=93214 RepID=UPI002FDE21B9
MRGVVAALAACASLLGLAAPVRGGDDAARLVADVRRHLGSSCVFLPRGRASRPPVYEERLAAETMKLLPTNASLYFESTESMLEKKNFQHCLNTSPLQVLVPRSNAYVDIMKQLATSYLWRSSVWLVVLARGETAGDLVRPVCGLSVGLVVVAELSPQQARLSKVVCPGTPSGSTPFRDSPEARLESLGRWSRLSGLSSTGEYEAAAANPLRGSHLRVAVLEVPRITEMYDNQTRVGGIFGKIWEAFGRDMNFTSEYVTVPDGAYGQRKPDGSWNGVVGMVMRREVDVGLAPLTMTKSRAEVVDFAIPLLMSNYMIFIRKPSTTQINWKSFMKPFSWELWLTVAVLVAAVGATNTVALALIRHHVGPATEERCSTADNLFYAFTILYCYQALDKLPNSLSCRTVYILTFLTAVVLSEAYSGKLISFIAVKKTYLPFTSLEGIYKDGTFKFGVVASTAEADLFKHSKEDSLRKVYRQLMAPDPRNYVPDELRGLQRACDMDYAFLSSYEETVSFVREVSCSVVTLPEIFFKSALAIALPRGSPYISTFNAKITAAMSSGVVSRLYRGAWPREEELPSGDTEPVELGSVVPLLNILVAGAAASLVLLAAEAASRPCRRLCDGQLGAASDTLHLVRCSPRPPTFRRGFSLARRHSF